MKRMLIAAAAVLAVGTTAALSQNAGIISQRIDVMKGAGAAAKASGAMMRGEAPFELAKAQAALTTYADAAKKMPGLFPDDSKTGSDTKALPVIWEKKADWAAAWTKFSGDIAAAQTAIKDEATFKSEWPKVMSNCGGCHKVFHEPPKQ
jgi:cytochrome c556